MFRDTDNRANTKVSLPTTTCSSENKSAARPEYYSGRKESWQNSSRDSRYSGTQIEQTLKPSKTKSIQNTCNSSDKSSDERGSPNKKTGIISCICLFPSWEPGLLKCVLCGNFSHAGCYKVKENVTHTCVHCALKAGVACTSDSVLDKKNSCVTSADKRTWVFDLNKR